MLARIAPGGHDGAGFDLAPWLVENSGERHGGFLGDGRQCGVRPPRPPRLIANLAGERVRVNLGARDGAAFSSLCEAVLMGDLDFEEAAARGA